MKFPLFLSALLVLDITANAQITTANNGLNTPTANTVQLGGSLLQTTTLDLSGYGFHLKNGSTPLFSILSNGNVGIGNPSPDARLTFPNAGDGEEATGMTWSSGSFTYQYGIHRTAGPWASPNYQQLRFGWETGIILDPGMSHGKSYVDIQGNGLRVTSGNVGIGTTQPGAKLSFTSVEDSDEPVGLSWYNPEPTGYGIHRTAGSWSAPNYQQLRLGWKTGIVLDPGNGYGKSYVDIQGSGLRVTQGNVGIGTTSPSGALHIMASSGDAGIVFNNSFNTLSSILWAANNVGFGLVSGGGLCAVANQGYGLTIGTSASNTSPGGMLNVRGAGASSGTYTMKIQNSNALDLFTVRDDGHVGVGTYSPAATLHVVPAAVGDGGVIFNNAINGYSSMLWASNNVGFGLVSGGGLFALAQPGFGLTIGSSATNASAGAMFNINAAGATASTYSVKVQNTNAGDIFAIRDDGLVSANAAVRFAGLTRDNAQDRVVVCDGGGMLAYRDASTLGGSGTAGWGFGGNSVPTSSALGTTSNFDLPIITNNTEQMRIGANGNVGIGTTSIANYRLSVNGNIRTRKIHVDQDTWADYVFENTYQLRSLYELEQFIQAQKHLPDVPSAAEVKKEGLDLGNNQAVMLKKIEELTLYVIEQNKRLDDQQKLLQQQQQQIEELKKITGK